MESVYRLTKLYIQAALLYGKTVQLGNHRLANREQEVLLNIYKFLSTTNQGKEVLVELMDYKDPAVKLWAATHCLKIDEVKARKVLGKLKKADDIYGYYAALRLIEWENGTMYL